MSQKKLQVEVYSDYCCPFCYIGFYRIEKLKKEFDLDVKWHPFEIHPETPKEGFNFENLPFPSEYLERVTANVNRLAAEDGLTLKFSKKLPNTRLALFIAEFAKKEGKFDQYHELIMEKYWKEGVDVGNLFILLDLCESIGLDREKIQEYIETDEPLNILRETTNELGAIGINGVPSFKIGGKFIVGAQPLDVFRRVIRSVIEKS